MSQVGARRESAAGGLVQPRVRLAVAAAAPASPRHAAAVGPDDLAPIFPMALIQQEVATERYIDIPEEVRDVYRLWRPTPLYRARRLEKALDTPAQIYFKYEGVRPAGSHKPNTAVAAGLLQQAGRCQAADDRDRRGPVGLRARFAGAFFGIEVKVYMVKVSFDQKPYRRR